MITAVLYDTVKNRLIPLWYLHLHQVIVILQLMLITFLGLDVGIRIIWLKQKTQFAYLRALGRVSKAATVHQLRLFIYFVWGEGGHTCRLQY